MFYRMTYYQECLLVYTSEREHQVFKETMHDTIF